MAFFGQDFGIYGINGIGGVAGLAKGWRPAGASMNSANYANSAQKFGGGGRRSRRWAIDHVSNRMRVRMIHGGGYECSQGFVQLMRRK